MSKPLVLFSVFFGGSWTNNYARFVGSADVLPQEEPLALRVIDRLRSFGYEKFYLHCFVYKLAWMTQADYVAEISRAQAFLAGCGMPGCVDSYDDYEALEPVESSRRSACVADAMAASDDEMVLSLATNSMLMTSEELEKVAAAAQIEKPVRSNYTGVLSWEAASAQRLGTLRKTRRDGTVADCVHIDSPVGASAPLPVSIRFEPTLQYAAALQALTDRNRGPWSRESLGALFKEQPALFRDRFIHVGVELTNDDNLPQRLRSPRRLAPLRVVGKMSHGDWTAILESLPAGPIPASLDIWDFGEPLLHPEAIDFISEAANRGIRVDLRTNGTLLDEKMAERLAASGVDAVFVRLDGASAESAAIVSGDTTAYDRARKGLELLLAAKVKHGQRTSTGWKPILAAELTEMKETRDIADAFFATWDRRAAVEKSLRTKLVREPSDAEIVEELYRSGSPLEYAIYRHDNLYRGALTRPAEEQWAPLFRFPCRQLYDGPYVLWNGDVVACREDIAGERVIGHVSDGLEAAWRGDRSRAFFDFHDSGCSATDHFCASCGEWYYPLA